MATEPDPPLLRPDWPAPLNVFAALSTRAGGVSLPPYDSLNLGGHVGDDAAAVRLNRRRFAARTNLREPQWLRQVHGCEVVRLPHRDPQPQADACYTTEPSVACAILVADCLPVLICDRDGTVVGAAHAGWRGLRAGVLEALVARLPVPAERLIAWLGPAIGPADYEVGKEVREAFVEADPAATTAFVSRPNGRWLADLYALARLRLRRLGVASIHGGDRSTYAEGQTFYSFRREGVTGRFAALIALLPAGPRAA